MDEKVQRGMFFLLHFSTRYLLVLLYHEIQQLNCLLVSLLLVLIASRFVTVWPLPQTNSKTLFTDASFKSCPSFPLVLSQVENKMTTCEIFSKAKRLTNHHNFRLLSTPGFRSTAVGKLAIPGIPRHKYGK